MLKSSWRNDDGNGVIILKLLVLGGLYAAVVLLVSDILIAVFLTAEHEKFSELPRGGFLMRTGNFWSFTLLLIFCDASLVVVFLLHLLNAEAKLWMVLSSNCYRVSTNPSEFYLGQFELHLIKSFSLHDIRCGNLFG